VLAGITGITGRVIARLQVFSQVRYSTVGNQHAQVLLRAHVMGVLAVFVGIAGESELGAASSHAEDGERDKQLAMKR
jgi:hypothetical protein